jgi:hypothetical protein
VIWVGKPPSFADANRLAHAIQHVGGFLAHVRNVYAAHSSDHLGEVDDFFGRREVARHIEESCGKAEGAIAHGLRGQFLHLLEFLPVSPAG